MGLRRFAGLPRRNVRYADVPPSRQGESLVLGRCFLGQVACTACSIGRSGMVRLPVSGMRSGQLQGGKCAVAVRTEYSVLRT